MKRIKLKNGSERIPAPSQYHSIYIVEGKRDYPFFDKPKKPLVIIAEQKVTLPKSSICVIL